MTTMVITKRAIARRTFVRGLGVTLALPLLDAMVPALTAAPKPAMRLGFIYVPNGVYPLSWLPDGDGSEFQLSPTLKALAPVRNQVVVLTGLANRQAAVGAG